jgi:hypothetical protein
MASDQKIAKLSEFVELTCALREEWFPQEKTWGPWFRGQTDANWDLVPSIYRLLQSGGPLGLNARALEDELRHEFLYRAPTFADVRPQTKWGWYFLMQHSLAPTRLLDWTEGSLLALYFAVRDNLGETDAAVWALDPWWLNKKALGSSQVFSPEATLGLSEENIGSYDRWLPDIYANRLDLPKLPVAAYPAYSARRISTQRSCFTVHGSEVLIFTRLLRERGACLRKIVIKSSATKKIRQELLTCGVDEVAIYPDLDGLGRYLTSVLRIETEPSKADS